MKKITIAWLVGFVGLMLVYGTAIVETVLYGVPAAYSGQDGILFEWLGGGFAYATLWVMWTTALGVILITLSLLFTSFNFLSKQKKMELYCLHGSDGEIPMVQQRGKNDELTNV
jgi:hypothetical protein